ncbi:polymorphic toxin-type HINT domain-containing protein [Amycolatopsis nigrescens]|uniref:polymorphic toxin-type HINT domain-containing protein n=1 Tax=Amycolatopsis nigrescens TaxID=381445 RepID=UPI00038267D2|nr:polymorphic toxin-type HINT domain-containing protein [Amycolatopsis nigrescens]
MAVAVVAGGVQPVQAIAAPVPPARAAAAAPDVPASEPRPMPESLYKEWNGTDGVDLTGDPRLRELVADIAELDAEPEVRDAAAAALFGDDEAIMTFLMVGEPEARAKANARKAEKARADRAAIEPLRGTGGPSFNAAVERVLAGTDSDRDAFLAYGAEIARAQDEKTAASAKELADRYRARVTMLAAAAGPGSEVQKAAQAALDAGDAAIATFLKTGYLVAARADADAREAYLREQRERQEAAEQLTELAKKAARASVARKNLLTAHGSGIRALQRASNALVSAGTEARRAAQILAANEAGGQHPPDSFFVVKGEVARQLEYANQAANDAQQASARASVEANILVETGLTYGAQWAQMAVGMAEASRAAVAATQTAQHAITATEATDQARDAQAKAEAHAVQATKWREHAQEHAAAAARLAEAARVQAVAAQDAAARARAARVAAEQAEQQAWAAAKRTRDARLVAESEAAKAAEARRNAERERAAAAAHRKTAESQAASARASRGQAEQLANVAEGARQRAVEQDGIAGGAETNARNEEGNARTSRDRAVGAEHAQQAAEAKAQALEAAAAAARGGAHGVEAQNAANAARGEANTARGAAVGARSAANAATGAAAKARSAATEATRAAARARAFAAEARAHADRANAAANKAEAAAAETHMFAEQANARAAEATTAEIQAAEHSREATRLAEAASAEAVASMRAADRTKAEADAASNEAVSAATQAGIAVQASLAARASSQAVTDPANTAITVVAPFTGSDIDADFIALVAAQAKAVGAEQAKAAADRATEAVRAAELAKAAADRAATEVKPAYDAAAAAAASSAAAARSAADAQAAAAAAAEDGALARAAGARANQADAQAQADARAARQAANAANNDAAIAGRAAAAAEKDAAAARSAASRAETDAAAARGAATRAEAAATAAEAAAASAQQHANNAAEAAKNALGFAIEAQQAADRAEQAAREAAERKRREEAERVGGDARPALSPDEEYMLQLEGGPELLQQYKEGLAAASKSILDFLRENGAEILLEVLGINDAKRCFGEGDVAACLWTVINVASIIAIIAKLPAVGAAVGRVIGGLDKFLETTGLAGRFLDKTLDTLEATKRIPCNCFPAGTPVAVEFGEKAIEDISVGDKVWARELGGDQSRLRTVVGLFNKRAEQLLAISAGGVDLRVTPQHPFWVVNRGWIYAGNLKVGDKLQSLDGTRPTVTGIVSQALATTVYNFEVEGDHNYYITKAQLLVHNCPVLSIISQDSMLVKAAEEAGRNPVLQREMDSLVQKFITGNSNPGIGTKALAGTGLSYLRGREGGRVFFRKVGDSMQIVAKADKSNESKVIDRLIELFGK